MTSSSLIISLLRIRDSPSLYRSCSKFWRCLYVGESQQIYQVSQGIRTRATRRYAAKNLAPSVETLRIRGTQPTKSWRRDLFGHIFYLMAQRKDFCQCFHFHQMRDLHLTAWPSRSIPAWPYQALGNLRRHLDRSRGPMGLGYWDG